MSTMTKSRATTVDGSGTVLVEDMVVTHALGALAWAKGRKWDVSLFKDMAARGVDVPAIEIEEVL